MDPPPLPPHPTAPTTATATTITPPAPTVSATSIHLNYPDSVESSPRSRLDPATNDDPLPQVPGAKLRLMCSYGGHIIPRPHDKSLCYVGGETRLVVVDRHSSLSSFCTRLSRSLLNGRPFTLKFQLPNEDLDSLVSVTTDEDLENMIEEYERLTSSSSSSSLSRIRLFIFFNKPETAATMGSLLDDAKSETWFVDALNGAGFIPRGLSDTNVDQLLNLDNEMTDLNNHVQEPPQNDTQETAMKNSNTTNTTTTASYHHDAQYPMPDSPMVESHSSFGSSSSSPSTSNLPPIRVRVVEDQRSTMEEQFAQMGFAPVAPPQVPVNVVVSGDQNSTNSRVVSDDERSDHGGNVVGSRKPPLPLQLQQPLQHNIIINSKAGAAVYSNLPSPDSVASDSSITSANSLSKPTHQHHQEQQLLTAPTNRTNPAPPIPNTNTDQIPISNRTPQFTQDPSFYALPPQLDHHHPPPPQQPPQQPPPQQQQYMHPSMHYIPHPASTPVPVPSYYQIYAPSPQPNQQPPHHHPVYVMPVTQAPPSSYMSMQPNMVDNANNAATSCRPPTPPTPAIVTAATTATSAGTPPVYPAKGTTTVAANSTSTTTTTQGGNNKPDQVTAAAVEYRTAAASAPPQMVQVPANQFQQQYVNYAHLQPPPHPSVAMAAPPGINNANNYGNYDHQHQHQHQHHQYHDHHQLYYTQHQAAAVPLPPQYQSMTPAAAAAALAEASAESANQQIRTQQKI